VGAFSAGAAAGLDAAAEVVSDFIRKMLSHSIMYNFQLYLKLALRSTLFKVGLALNFI
jgi:hypothetical protein